MVTALITVAAIAWICQLALGGWQIHQFNQAFDKLAQLGAIGVGRSGGRFKPRVVIAVAVDQQGIISDSLIMRGLTVFARTQKIAALKGQPWQQIEPDVIFPHDQSCQNALSLALKLKHR
ncbi:MAG: transcriptional regulator GutM [Scandinavium sp.]|uniref:transcriptional regulator GutM n=1 Tax=Scandinavium sp. TaxID=2830653 RepID=UPI003F37C591